MCLGRAKLKRDASETVSSRRLARACAHMPICGRVSLWDVPGDMVMMIPVAMGGRTCREGPWALVKRASDSDAGRVRA